jgi:hypothetical protein
MPPVTTLPAIPTRVDALLLNPNSLPASLGATSCSKIHRNHHCIIKLSMLSSASGANITPAGEACSIEYIAAACLQRGKALHIKQAQRKVIAEAKSPSGACLYIGVEARVGEGLQPHESCQACHRHAQPTRVLSQDERNQTHSWTCETHAHPFFSK